MIVSSHHERPALLLHQASDADIEAVRRDGQQVADALETLWYWALERDTDRHEAHPMVRASLEAGAALQRILGRFV